MTTKTQAELKAKFETGKIPTYQDFVDLVESILHVQLGNFPDPLPAVSGKNLKDIGDALPDPLPARDGKNLYNINPQEYNIPSGITPSYASANTFVVTGDYTSGAATVANRIFLVGRRLRLTIAGSYTYTEVLSASYNAGTDITTVTTADNMPGSNLTAVAVGIITPNSAGGAVGTGTIFGTSNTINGAINYAAAVEAVAGTDYTGTHSPALAAAALVAGLELHVKFPTANTSTAPRYNPNGTGYKKIFKDGGSALAQGDIVAGGHHTLSYDPTLDAGAGGFFLKNHKINVFTNGIQFGSPTGGDKGAGTVNVASGIYDNGTKIEHHSFGTWQSKSSDTVYQASTDGFVVAHGTGAAKYGYSDGSNPPTTERARDVADYSISVAMLSFPVRKGDYWKVTNCGSFVYFLPIS